MRIVVNYVSDKCGHKESSTMVPKAPIILNENYPRSNLSDKYASVDRTSKLGIIASCHNVGYY